MTVIQLASIAPASRKPGFLTTPTGDIYMMGTPSVSMAHEMVTSGIRKVVFVADRPRSDWDEARRILIREGIRIEGSWNT